MRSLSTAVFAIVLIVSGAALAQSPQTQASVGSGKPADIQRPVCDRTHTDECIELGQNAQLDRQLRDTYPQCARVAGIEQRAACFNRANGQG